MSEKNIGIMNGPLITLESTFESTTLPPIPVYYPTKEEFADFPSCIAKIEQMGAHHIGLCKVVPPDSWNPTIEDQDYIQNLKVISPIIQKCTGTGGVYIQSFSRLVTDLYDSPPSAKTMSYIENIYWKTIAESSPIYGANVEGSLMKETETSFNIRNLSGVLSDTLNEEKSTILGVNTPYLYFGSWRATFPWHVEDSELYSINYVHFGAPKFWYVIPPAYARRFEAFARELYKSEYGICKNFYRHKCILIKPSLLAKAGILVRKILQKKQEIMITFPYCYHSGFNIGLNVAESTNFASERWVNYGKKSKFCYCWEDTVRINMDPFVFKYHKAQFEDWVRGIDNSLHPLDEIYTKAILEHKKKSKLKPTPEEDNILVSSHNIENLSLDGNSGTKSQEDSSEATTVTNNLEKKIAMLYTDLDLNKCSIESSLDKEPKEIPELLKIFNTYLSGKSIQPKSLEAEIEYNKMVGNQYPNCAVCCYMWKPKKFEYVVKEWIVKNGVVNERSESLSTEPLISETAFSLTMQDHIRPMDIDPKSQVIHCSRCHLSVHLRCYSELEFMEDALDQCAKKNWLCLACQEEVVYLKRPSCIFCQNIGGAIIPLKNSLNELTNQRYWCHIVCAIGSRHARFNFNEICGLNVKLVENMINSDGTEDQMPLKTIQQPISGASKRKQSLSFWDSDSKMTYSSSISVNKEKPLTPIVKYNPPCCICGLSTTSTKLQLIECTKMFQSMHAKVITGEDVKNNLKSKPVDEKETPCCDSFAHCTCIQWATQLVVNADLWPNSFVYICKQHSDEYEKQEHRFLVPIKKGDNVYAWCHIRKRWITGTIECLLPNSCFCKVTFIDGQYSSDVPLYKINDYDWDSQGLPEIGSQIQVTWKNGVKTAFFEGLNVEKWKIKINPKGVCYRKRAEFYHLKEDVPKSIIDEATPKQKKKTNGEQLEDESDSKIVQKRRCEMPILNNPNIKKPKINLKRTSMHNEVDSIANSTSNKRISLPLPNKKDLTEDSDDDFDPRTCEINKHLNRKSTRRSKNGRLFQPASEKRPRGRPRLHPRSPEEICESTHPFNNESIKFDPEFFDKEILVKFDNQSNSSDETKEPISVESSYLKCLNCPIVDSD